MPSTSQGPKNGRTSSSKGPRTKLGYDTTIQAGVDTIEIEWLVKTVEELRAGAEKLSQGNDLLAKGIDGFFEVVMTSGDTLLRSVRIDKTVNDRSPGHNRDMQVVHELCNSLTLVGFGGGGVPL